MKTKLKIERRRSLRLWALGLLIGLNVHAQTAAPDKAPRVTVRPALIPCTTPVTPETVVPWVELSALPDVSRSTAYWEHCTNIDHAWTTQSYPDPKFTPPRTPEHEARVRAFLQGIKDYVAADAEDWVAYVNAWLGSTLPPSKIDSKKYPTGDTDVYSISFERDRILSRFGTGSKILGVYGYRYASQKGSVSNKRKISINGLNTETLCITPVDIQQAFENQPGYLFRPLSVRTSNRRPNADELAKLGGQWFGYEVHVFTGHATGQSSGRMSFSFQFKPCADSVEIELTKNLDLGEKK